MFPARPLTRSLRLLKKASNVDIPLLPNGKPDLKAKFRLPVPESLPTVTKDGVKLVRWEVHQGKSEGFNPPTDVEVTGEELVNAFRSMLTMRRMESQTQQEYQLKKIRGFCHLYIGQEACLTGMEAAVTWKDSIITSYRDHAHYLTRGGTVKEVLSEMYGHDDGGSRGKGGSMHFWAPQNGFYGGHGIVGAQIPLGAGLAFAHWYRNPQAPEHVALVLYGDGAANQGQAFEAFNMAALWRLPAIFVIENNHFGMGTAEDRAAANTKFYTRGDTIPGLKADGMDYLCVKAATAFARSWSTAGKGPVLLELDSYRYVGHSMSDPGTTYRTKDDVSVVRNKRDCIAKMKTMLWDYGLLTPEETKEIEGDVTRHVKEEISAAQKSAPSAQDMLWKHVYVNDELPVRSCDASNLVLNKEAMPHIL